MLLTLGVAGAAGAENVPAEGAVENAEAVGVAEAGLLKLKLAPPMLPLAENPEPPRLGLGVLGLGDPPLLAASSALALRSLSLPASIIPDRVPVKNVAIGMISSKNF